MKKRLIGTVLCLAMLVSLLPVALAAGGTAYASTQNILFNGESVELQAYALKDANGNPTNYVKLRDVAYLLNGTGAQFEVTWDGAVNLVTGQAYTANGSEMFTPFSGNRHYTAATAATKINGAQVAMDAITLTDDMGGGYTYYKLRDLGVALGFAVDWSAETGITVDTPTSTPAQDYDPVIDFYDIPPGLGLPLYSVSEIQQMVRDDLTLDQVAEKISTLADLIQYLHQKGYGRTENFVGDLQFQYGGLGWHASRSAQIVFDVNEGNCGGGSNLANYILRGDYDEQGYVTESANRGGHIYNYFMENGVYYFCDFTNIVVGGSYSNRSYRIFETTEPQEFSDWYVSRENDGMKPSDDKYLVQQFMYAWEGDCLPVTNTKPRSGFDAVSSEARATTRVLYEYNEDYSLKFLDPPPPEAFPDAQTAARPNNTGSGSNKQENSEITLYMIERGSTVTPGNGMGNNHETTVAVYLDGVRTADFTVSGWDPAVCDIQKTADGDLCITVKSPGETRFTVTAGGTSASFGWKSH